MLCTGCVDNLILKIGIITALLNLKRIAMYSNSRLSESGYLSLYKYLLVLSEDQITKLRKIAVGILTMSAFSDEEMNVLENRLHAR
jgi:hypothetical protein